MFRLSIVTPEKVFLDAQVKSLTVPGSEGYLGILSNHAPIISALKAGKIEFRDASDTVQLVAVSGGFLEVSNNVATILADAVEYASEIDIDRARAAYDRCKNQLISVGQGDTGLDLTSVRLAMERAANRIRIFEQGH